MLRFIFSNRSVQATVGDLHLFNDYTNSVTIKKWLLIAEVITFTKVGCVIIATLANVLMDRL